MGIMADNNRCGLNSYCECNREDFRRVPADLRPPTAFVFDRLIFTQCVNNHRNLEETEAICERYWHFNRMLPPVDLTTRTNQALVLYQANVCGRRIQGLQPQIRRSSRWKNRPGNLDVPEIGRIGSTGLAPNSFDGSIIL